MPQFKWSERSQVDQERDYVVMVSQLPLQKYGSIPGFLWATLAIRRQLRTAPGLVGYALLAALAQKTFWTFSVWVDRPSLDAFASSRPHDQIIRKLAPTMDQTVFKFSEARGSRLPWTWEEVKVQLKTKDC